MKKMLPLFVFLSLFSLALLSQAYAQEGVMPQPLNAGNDSWMNDSLSFTITSSGKLLTKPGPVFTEGGNYEGIVLPYLTSTPKPISYPRWAIRQGWEGKVSIALEILPNGKVGRTKVMQSTGYPLLDKTADKAVHGWNFHPAMKDGKAIVTCIQIPISFKLLEE